MNIFKNTVLILFVFLSFYSKAQVIDDSTQNQYGVFTTGFFTENDLINNNRIFYKRDSVYSSILNLKSLFISLPKNKKEKLDILKSKNYYQPIEEIDTNNQVVNQSSDPKPSEKNLIVDTSLIYQKRFFKNRIKYSHPDTGIYNMHRYNLIRDKDQVYQNLGVRGTAMYPIFYTLPSKIGYQVGFNIYDRYSSDPSKIRYFDTKSPFSKITYLQGTTGEQGVGLEFSRNITSRTNFGLNYDRYTSTKQIGVAKVRDFLSFQQNFYLQFSTRSKNDRYIFAGNFTYFAHVVNEQGGIKLSKAGLQNQDSLFRYELSKVQLSPPSSVTTSQTASGGISLANNKGIFTRDRRVGFHFYHQYDILQKGLLSVYHIFNRSNQKMMYNDPFLSSHLDINTTGNFYQNYYQDTARTSFKFETKDWTQTLGLNGKNKNSLYQFYAKFNNTVVANNLNQLSLIKTIKNLQQVYGSEPNMTYKLNQYFVGGSYSHYFNDSTYLRVNSEVLLGLKNTSSNDTLNSLFRNNHDYQLGILYHYRQFNLGFNNYRYSPTLVQTYINHNNFRWQNKFLPTTTNELFVEYNQNFSFLNLRLRPSYQRISHLVYFDENSISRQAGKDSAINIFTFIGNLNFNIGKKFHIDNFVRQTITSGPDLIRMPKIYLNTSIYYVLKPKKYDHLLFHIGLDFNIRSSYFGNAYMPGIMQYQLQNSMMLNGNSLVDFFANIKIRNARVFVKLSNLTQMAGLSKGYFVTPYYPGMKFSFQFGVQWLLFD